MTTPRYTASFTSYQVDGGVTAVTEWYAYGELGARSEERVDPTVFICWKSAWEIMASAVASSSRCLLGLLHWQLDEVVDLHWFFSCIGFPLDLVHEKLFGFNFCASKIQGMSLAWVFAELAKGLLCSTRVAPQQQYDLRPHEACIVSQVPQMFTATRTICRSLATF